MKHKAMRLDNGKWVEGFYVELENFGYKEHLIYTGKFKDDMRLFPERFDVIQESVKRI